MKELNKKILTYAQRCILDVAKNKAQNVEFQDQHLEDDDYSDIYEEDYNDDSE
ncbi:hypothetical protein [uncultured Alistipes sp.]|uniref:hypothetical protein n=1 Tax=uncultured Alistipes sp. TaxID=538949 RepID=UPI002634950F|nr:hypothetical protein [uncultured Alistipes sp.]